MNTFQYVLNRVRSESTKNRTLLFDIWIDTTKISDKEQLDAESLEEKLSEYPDAGFIRIRMYWTYGQGTKRFLEEMAIKGEPKPVQTMEGLDDDDDDDDEPEEVSPVRGPKKPAANTPAIGGQRGYTMALDMNNPLSWMLQEKTTQLDAVRAKYETAKERIEKLREDKERLERELIQRDHRIENLTSEVEEGAGLNGFLTKNPSVAERAIDVLGPSLAGLISGNMQQLAGGYGGVAKDVADWIQEQDEEDQTRIREIMTEIARRAQAAPDFLEALRSQMLKYQQNGTHTVS